ncbi:DUF262 domain-containing protein [Shewanella sp. SM55]|uniref:DUF262 domain-containing protein n=1 Tax=Shewanella sp. SM55 TaxID=2912800 RepID=UPI0021DAD18D|nr:DUF262 domain-containing protein [Shewanella sp. SM55]MCU8063014.1 DUF262 domain-containing protein [Shewanella sp. SM55]
MTEPLDLEHDGQRLSFFQLFRDSDLKIEIPIIQRDYAQGRQKEAVVRETFLQALFEYLATNRPFNDLDFVYGSITESSKFIPLDGQQRLTTLFLLHWYLAVSAGEQESFNVILSHNRQARFTYETRSSSREFCDALVTYLFDYTLIEDSASPQAVSSIIKDQHWFFTSWCLDPTIQAMLTMLDAIHLKFKEHPEFYLRLTHDESPVITFRFLNLEKFLLTDDLYIKMNARGKPLTAFENFKAKLEKKIQSFHSEWPLNYSLAYKAGPISGYDYFIHKIDNEWADVFWPFRNTYSDDNTFDDELMNFIGLFIAQQQLLRGGIDIDEVQYTFFESAKVKRLSLQEYESANALSQALVIKLIELLDLLSDGNSKQGGLTRYLIDNDYYQEVETFEKVLANSTSYPEKLRFFAFYSAVANGKRDQELVEWMRVVFNLTEQKIFNTFSEYYASLVSLNELARHQTPILELLRDNIDIKAFPEYQVFEEKLKAHLLLKSTQWRTSILQLELHPYLKGQIGFVLKFSGIVDYFSVHQDVEWPPSDNEFLSRFLYYAKAAESVFDVLKDGSNKMNYAWERAVLCKGIYFISKGGNPYNLLSSLSAKNARRDFSWSRLLRLSLTADDEWNQKQSYVQQVFDDPIFDTDNVVQSLESICSTNVSTRTFDQDNWQHLLITTPSLFEISSQGFVTMEENTVILMHQSQRNHKQSEIRTAYLFNLLKTESFDCLPFSIMDYEPVRGIESRPYIEFAGLHYLGGLYELDVSYTDASFTLTFKQALGEYEALPQNIENELFELGFVRDGFMEGLLYWFKLECYTLSSVKEAVYQTCNILDRLADG